MLFGLLEEFASSTETAPTTISAPTTFIKESASPAAVPTQSSVVGPTTAELESINELIQFDHVYYKPSQTPQVKQVALVSVLKPVTKTSQSSPKSITTPQVQKQLRGIRAKPATTEAPLGLNLGDVDLEKLSDTLEQVADFDQMFKQLAESHTSSDVPATLDMDNATDNTIKVNQGSKKRRLSNSQELSNQVSAKKAKHTDNVQNVNINISMSTNLSDSLTTPDPLECGYLFDFEEGFSSSGLNHSDSGYTSEPPFSPGSDLPSPYMPETTSAWEESFTELFPSLL